MFHQQGPKQPVQVIDDEDEDDKTLEEEEAEEVAPQAVMDRE